MFAAICIEKTPFTSFHNSKMVIPLLAVLEPLWPHHSLWSGGAETADDKQTIICCWFIGWPCVLSPGGVGGYV